MNNNTAIFRRSLRRIAVESAVLLLLAVLLVETWLAKGIVSPCRVVGGSMADSLPGRRRIIVCADCGYPFSCGTDCPRVPPRAVCPNCGYADNDLQAMPDIEGKRLLIDRASLLPHRLRRWEIVAMRRPTHADEIVVKRIVGMPGETVEIRDGDVYINGEISRKNAAEQSAVAVPVHDAGYRPTLEQPIPPRWRPESRNTRWQFAEDRYKHTAEADSEPIDWLVYHHGRPGPLRNSFPGNMGATAGQASSGTLFQQAASPTGFVESPVRDLYGYNQSRPRRDEDVHAVADLMLSFSLARESDRGMVCIRATDGVKVFETRLRFNGERLRFEATVRADRPIADVGEMQSSGTGPFFGRKTHFAGIRLAENMDLSPSRQDFAFLLTTDGNGEVTVQGRENHVCVSLIDRQFMLTVDGRTTFSIPFKRSEHVVPTTTPFAIGVQGMAASVGRLRICRDVYYTDPIGLPPRGAIRLAADEYYVLGDNSPSSEDSRFWPDCGVVNAGLLLGRVIEPFASNGYPQAE